MQDPQSDAERDGDEDTETEQGEPEYGGTAVRRHSDTKQPSTQCMGRPEPPAVAAVTASPLPPLLPGPSGESLPRPPPPPQQQQRQQQQLQPPPRRPNVMRGPGAGQEQAPPPRTELPGMLQPQWAAARRLLQLRPAACRLLQPRASSSSRPGPAPRPWPSLLASPGPTSTPAAAKRCCWPGAATAWHTGSSLGTHPACYSMYVAG